MSAREAARAAELAELDSLFAPTRGEIMASGEPQATAGVREEGDD
jgi:hypothetical protein